MSFWGDISKKLATFWVYFGSFFLGFFQVHFCLEFGKFLRIVSVSYLEFAPDDFCFGYSGQ